MAVHIQLLATNEMSHLPGLNSGFVLCEVKHGGGSIMVWAGFFWKAVAPIHVIYDICKAFLITSQQLFIHMLVYKLFLKRKTKKKTSFESKKLLSTCGGGDSDLIILNLINFA